MADAGNSDITTIIRHFSHLEEALNIFPSIIYVCPVNPEEGGETIARPGFVTANIHKFLGYDRSQLISEPDFFAGCLHPMDKAGFLAGRRSLLDRGEAHLEYRFMHSDGSYRWLQDEAALMRNQAGEPVAVIGTWLEITERKRVKQELAQYELQCRLLFENMQDVYYRTDMQGKIEMISPSCLAQTGYRREELLGRPVTDFYEDPSRRGELLEVLGRQGWVNDFEVKLVRKDGTPRFASVTSHLILDEDHKPVGMEGILRDITDRINTEKRLRLLLQENRQLTRQLMHVQEEERRMLARDLHDDLAQLLTGINARAEFVVRHAADTELAAKATEIIDATKALFRFSRAILQRLRPSTLDALGLDAALSELTDDWQRQTGMQCRLELGGRFDRLGESHRIAIYRLVQEGLTNACRHGKADRVDVVVQQSPASPQKQERVYIEIRDNGMGIDTDNAFTGMGMIGMRERVYALGGTFMLTNLPGDGARIEASIPLTESDLEER